MGLAWQPLTAIQAHCGLKGLGSIVENPFGPLAECSAPHSPDLRCNKYFITQGKIDSVYEWIAFMAQTCHVVCLCYRGPISVDKIKWFSNG